jgi:hypothetical protein
LCQISLLSRCSPRYLTSSWGSCMLFISVHIKGKMWKEEEDDVWNGICVLLFSGNMSVYFLNS